MLAAIIYPHFYRISLRTRAPVHVGRRVVLEPEIPALQHALRRQERNVPAQLSRLLLEILKLVVGDGPERLAAAN